MARKVTFPVRDGGSFTVPPIVISRVFRGCASRMIRFYLEAS